MDNADDSWKVPCERTARARSEPHNLALPVVSRSELYKKNVWYISGIFDLTALDLVTKWLAHGRFEEPFVVIRNFLNLSYTENPNIAFSIPVPGWLVAWITPLIITVLVWFVIRSCSLEGRRTKISLMLILAGALGNFINRVYTGTVIDFIDFSFWPSFNFADMYLTIGTALLIIACRQTSDSTVFSN